MSDLDRTGWFADLRDEDDEDLVPGYPCTPYLQSPGLCTPLRIGFASKAECEQWIKDNVLRLGMLRSSHEDSGYLHCAGNKDAGMS